MRCYQNLVYNKLKVKGPLDICLVMMMKEIRLFRFHHLNLREFELILYFNCLLNCIKKLFKVKSCMMIIKYFKTKNKYKRK